MHVYLVLLYKQLAFFSLSCGAGTNRATFHVGPCRAKVPPHGRPPTPGG